MSAIETHLLEHLNEFTGFARNRLADPELAADAVQDRAIARMERELDSPPTTDEKRVACGCLERLIPTLKPQYSTLLRRLDLEGEALQPVAASLGITTNNLKVRLHRARQQLKERVTQTCRVCAQHGCLDCTCDSASERKR